MIGTTPCEGGSIITKTRIVCEVPPLPIGTYDVTVIVPGDDGNLLS